jgi:hypothetical protein
VGRWPDESDAERFWRKVTIAGGTECWLWSASTSTTGYGQFAVKRGAKKCVVRAHRFAYEITHGPIPAGLVIDHLCNEPLCVNPAHLRAVTNRENVLRGSGPTAQNARKTHCPRGHAYDAGNTHVNPNGQRVCRECLRARAARNRAKARQAALNASSPAALSLGG